MAYMADNRFIHRDLATRNCLVNSRKQIKITDFGFSCFTDPVKGLKTNLGTVAYMAPEIFSGNTYNEKVDIWATGVIAY